MDFSTFKNILAVFLSFAAAFLITKTIGRSLKIRGVYCKTLHIYQVAVFLISFLILLALYFML